MSTNIWYVVITLKNGEVYQGGCYELGPRVTGDPATADTQGIWLQRNGCSTFIPGQDVKKGGVEWIECRDEGDEGNEAAPEPEPELELVTV